MAINRSTLHLLRRLQVSVGSEADAVVRSLTHAWTRSWDELSTAWQTGMSDAVAKAAATGKWPSAWELAKTERLRQATIASEEALLKLSSAAGITIADGAGQVIAATADAEPHLIASQLPAAEQVAAAARFAATMAPTALSAIVARTQSQIVSTMRPLSPAASEAMRRELIKGIAVGDNPRTAAAAMVNRVQGAFEGGLVRAVNVARTEMLDAYRATSTFAHAANADVVSGWVWHAQLDSRTCFPAGTLVLTRRGEVPIEAVRVGDEVLTHLDRWRTVYETMARPYAGRMVTVETGPLRVTATADHPFLVERQGELQWVQAGDLRRGDCVFSHREGGTDGSNHGLREVAIERRRDEADNREATVLQEQGLCGVPCSDLGMPVRLVDLEGDVTDQEVDRALPTEHGALLLVRDSESLEAEPYVALGLGFAGEASVAAHAAELRPGRRDDADPLAAGEAVNLDGRAATLLGAVCVLPSVNREHLAAAAAGDVPSVGGCTDARAGRVTIRVAARNSEGSTAPRADLLNLAAGGRAGTRALLPRPGRTGLEAGAASFAADVDARLDDGASAAVRTLPLMRRVAGLPAEPATALAHPCGGDVELGAATVAGSFHRHIISNVESQTQTITVYNVEVDEDHTYAAGGFVVHNCPSCWSMHGRVFPVDMPGPADHQQGRCARLPKTRTWRELGFNIDEPADTIVNARTRFASLPDAQQRTIMGPGRLALLRSGRVDWADLSGLRTAEGWRPSYAPRAVHDLERLGMRRAPLTDAQRVAQIAADQHAQLERIMADQSARVQALLGDVHKRFGDLGIPPVPMPRATMPRGPITLTPADASRFADMDVEAIARSRGLDAVPTLAAASDVDAAVQRGWVEAWRGVKRVETNDAFRVGELEFGQGLFGRGYYFTTERGVAEVYRGADVKFGPDYRIQSYSGGVDGGLLRVAINPDARIVDYDALLAERKALLETWRAEGRLTPAAEKLLADRDVSKYASARGYDVIRVRNRTDGVNIDNWPDQYVVLNRQAVLVEGTPELAAARDVARTVAAADDPALKMTVAALKQIAKDNGIQLYAGIKKYDIIHRIRLWESDRLKSGGKILIPDGPIGKPIRFGLAAIDAPPLGIPPTGKPMLTGSALNDWADHFSYDLQYARHEFVDKAGDTAAEGVRVKNLRVALGAYDGSYPDYVVANGTAWRFNGVSYLIEHGPNDFGAPWVSRALTELRAVHEAVPAAVRANKSYTVLQRPSPADVYWRKKFNNPAHTGAMSAGDGHINIYNFQPAISRIETKIDQFRHETGHNLDSLAGRTTAGSQSPAWVAAVDADAVTAARIRDLHPTHYEATKLATVEPGRGYPKGVTDYGRSSAAEDYAESVMLYQLGPIATGRLPGAVTPKLTGVRLPPGATAVTDSEVLYFRDIYPKRATILDKLFPDIAKAQKAEIAALRAGAAPDLSKLTVPQLRELARQRGFQAIATLRKADLVALLNKPPLTPAERAAAERATQRAAARERNRQIEQATGTAKLLAHVDELIAKKADLAVIRQSLIPKLIEPGSLFANADPLILAALRKAADAGDLTKLRAAITRLSTKAKIKPISKAGTTVKFNPDTMEPFAGDIKAGTQVTVVTRGSSVTLPDGTVLQLEKARVQPVPKPVKATPSGIPKPDLTVAPEHLVASVRQALESANFTEIEAYERIKPGMFYRGRGHVDVGFLQGFQHDYPAVWARLVTEARSEWALDRTIEHFGIKGTREQIKARIEANLKKQLASAKVVVRRANESSLRDILERGRMRTQFETKMSGGDYAPTKRARFEEAIWGYARRTDPALRPVYGYMSPLGDESVWPVGQYGGIRIVLKDTVRERTSFAMGDSLGARVGFSPLDSPEWSSYRTFLFTDPTKPVDFWTGDFQKNARYVEAQIHGGVAVDDIAEVIFDGTPSQETIEALKRAGVPWRTAK